jgi:phosphatidyl-myo-inositol alpha-mannosyltransferase
VRVALVCPYSWSVPGGVQSHVAGLARALTELGHDAEILAPLDRSSEHILGLGRSIPIPTNGSVQRVALSPRSVARTARALRRRGYDVVHVHEPMLPSVGLTALAAARAPVVGTFHMFRQALLWYSVFRPVVRAAARQLDSRIAVSEAARDYAARALPGEYVVIPNGIDFEALAAVPNERRGGRILFVGRPEPRKGLPVLLEAFHRLGSDAELVLVGPRGEFGARIHALGRIGDEELRRELGRADVVCAPSLGSESFGVVLVEAMAAGATVVATRIRGYADLVGDAALLVPPGDADALDGALREALADDRLRRTLAARGREVAVRFAWPTVAREVIAVYGAVLGATPPTRGRRGSARDGGGRRSRAGARARA